MIVSSSYEIAEQARFRQVILSGEGDQSEFLENLQAACKDPGSRKTFVRLTSEKFAQRIESAKPENAQEIYQLVKSQNVKGLTSSVIGLATGAFSLAWTVMLTMGTGGAPIILALAFFACVSLPSFIEDMQKLVDAIRKGEAGRYDRLVMLASTILCTAGSVLALLLADSIPALVFASVMGIVFLTLNLGVLYAQENSSISWDEPLLLEPDPI